MEPEIISVTCVQNVDPPAVLIVLAGEVPLQVSLGLYDYLRSTSLPDLPPDPCGS